MRSCCTSCVCVQWSDRVISAYECHNIFHGVENLREILDSTLLFSIQKQTALAPLSLHCNAHLDGFPNIDVTTAVRITAQPLSGGDIVLAMFDFGARTSMADGSVACLAARVSRV